MPAPNILPNLLPKNTKFFVGPDPFIFLTPAIKRNLPSLFGVVSVYVGDVKDITSGSNFTNYSVYSHAVDWDSIEEFKEESDVDSCIEPILPPKHCLWCNELLGSNQFSDFCEVGKVYCKDYYSALKDRMGVDFRKPNEALPCEKDSVVRWVKNNLGIK